MRCILAGALIAVFVGVGAAQARGQPPIREVVSFGDSLSDCGAFGFKPTTAPSPTWNELVARHYGYDLLPSWVGPQPNMPHSGVAESHPGGLCYAQGGARTAEGAPGQLPIPGTVQLDRFLAEHGHFTDDQLVTVYLGTNDVLINSFKMNAELGKGNAAALGATRAVVEQAARDLATLVRRMLDNGAKRVAVLDLYDLGASGFITANPLLTGLSQDFNATLHGALPADPRIIPVDTWSFFAKLAANPAAHGFKHPMNDDACQTPTALGPDCYATRAKWKSSDADRTYMLVGMVHFTARTEGLLADYVLRRVERFTPPKSRHWR
jgi:outer membrane lipase/esterase